MAKHMHEGDPFQKGCAICERRLLDALSTAFTAANDDMTMEEVDEELRAAGLDPVQVGNSISELVVRLSKPEA
jgi:hypothetical protein